MIFKVLREMIPINTQDESAWVMDPHDQLVWMYDTDEEEEYINAFVPDGYEGRLLRCLYDDCYVSVDEFERQLRNHNVKIKSELDGKRYTPDRTYIEYKLGIA